MKQEFQLWKKIMAVLVVLESEHIFRKFYIVLLLSLVLLPSTFAFNTNSENYNIQISEVGVAIINLSSTNYQSLSTIQDKYVGQNESDNYRDCVGWYCFIFSVLEEETVEEELEREGVVGAGGYDISYESDPKYVDTIQSFFSDDAPRVVVIRNRSFAVLLMLSIVLFVLVKRDRRKSFV
jgi:hypothetical protein